MELIIICILKCLEIVNKYISMSIYVYNKIIVIIDVGTDDDTGG